MWLGGLGWPWCSDVELRVGTTVRGDHMVVAVTFLSARR